VLEGASSNYTKDTFDVLIAIKSYKKNSDETKSLYEDYLGDRIRCLGMDHQNTAYAYRHLAVFNHEIVKFCPATDAKIKETIVISLMRTKVFYIIQCIYFKL
jgi:hypothetical protein